MFVEALSRSVPKNNVDMRPSHGAHEWQGYTAGTILSKLNPSFKGLTKST